MNNDIKVGDSVKLAYPTRGYDADIKKAKKFLSTRKTYVVKDMMIDDWRMDVCLKEVPNESFNSVQFELLTKKC